MQIHARLTLYMVNKPSPAGDLLHIPRVRGGTMKTGALSGARIVSREA
jgi:hypothetical protein